MSLSERTKTWLRSYCNISLKGKTVLVTGANSGIGFKTAETAVYLGAKVIMACRSHEKAHSAKDKLLEDY
ncbi:MAG: SDR family NAD(P)-dependent oxidoreductase, partial [Parasporobacterium sp.]|nr:SDR family NAD(P)-dependent oxidoreductase [Parasporobacterium sp.]